MKFFKAGKSKNPGIPVLIGVVLVIVLVVSVTSAQSDTRTYVAGSWDGGVFTSDFLKLQFTLPDGWTAASQEELDSLMQQAMEQTRESDPETAKGYENGTVKNAYELKATEDGGDGLVVVMAQKMKVSADSYLEKLAEQYEGTATLNDLPGWTLGGVEYKGLKVEQDGRIQYIYVWYEGGYFTTIQLAGDSDGELMELRDEQFADHAAAEN